MRQWVSSALVGLHTWAVDAGLLSRPRAQRAFEALYLLYKGAFETGPVGGLRELVTPGSIVIDVGANIGFFAVLFARWTGPDGRVVAIEPEPRNLASLRRRIGQTGLQGVIEAVPAVAADHAGELRLALTPGHPGDHHIAASGIPVEAVTLDDLVAGDSRAVSLVKIDAQGAEALVLGGARRLLAEARPALYVELDAIALERMGSSVRELLAIVLKLGYRPRALTGRGVGAEQDPELLVSRSAAGYVDALFIAG